MCMSQCNLLDKHRYHNLSTKVDKPGKIRLNRIGNKNAGNGEIEYESNLSTLRDNKSRGSDYDNVNPDINEKVFKYSLLLKNTKNKPSLNEGEELGNETNANLEINKLAPHETNISDNLNKAENLYKKIKELELKNTKLEQKINYDSNNDKQPVTQAQQQPLKFNNLNKLLNNTEIFPNFMNMAQFNDNNLIYFKLISSICASRYFDSKL